MEPNPPQPPPQEQEPLTAGKIAKRGLGAGAILLLTPVAVVIAFGASCVASYAVARVAMIGGLDAQIVVSAVLVLFVVIPAVVLTAMIRWAIKAGGIGPAEPKPERPKSLLEHLVALPSVGSVVLMILLTVVISALVFTWLAYNMTAFQPPSR